MNNLKNFEDFDWKFGFGEKKKNIFGDHELDPYGEEDWNNLEEYVENMEFGVVDNDHYKILYLKLKPGEYMSIGHIVHSKYDTLVMLRTTYLRQIITDNDPIVKQGHYKIDSPPYVGKIPFGEIKNINDLLNSNVSPEEEVKKQLYDYLSKYDKNGILIKKIEEYKRSLT